MILVNIQRYIVGKIMRTTIYNWLLKDIIPYIRFTTYYTHPTNKKFPKWGALANLGYEKLKPGHIILTVDEKKLTTMLISKFTGEEGFSHAAQCISKDGKFEIAEMTHTNFTKSTWYDLCYESTRVVILECAAYDEEYIRDMIEITPEFENKPYDNLFQMGVEALSCAELCYMYDKDRRMKINLEPVLGSDPYISPMGLYKGTNMTTVWDSDNETRTTH